MPFIFQRKLSTESLSSCLRTFLPGIIMSLLIAIAGILTENFLSAYFTVPATVIALFLGILLNPFADKPLFREGMAFCVRKMLRWAVALLGFKIMLMDIGNLGFQALAITVSSMLAALLSAFYLSRLSGQKKEIGALAGSGTAVCGASAVLAASTVIPDYNGKGTDITFHVMMANILATILMVIMPSLAHWLSFDARETGILLGATIHDVAQVAGAAQAVSEEAGNNAIIIKLVRVFLLLPVVISIGILFSKDQKSTARYKVPVPVFAIMFLVFCCINSLIAYSCPALMPLYTPLRSILLELSRWGLLIAIAALGLGTSVRMILSLGWRHGTAMCGASLVLILWSIGAIFMMRLFA